MDDFLFTAADIGQSAERQGWADCQPIPSL